jgi:lactoylglutathione lyase
VVLGNFSVGLSVKNFAKSREFYEKLGFCVIRGDNTRWAIMQNASATIGIYEGVIEKNILTFTQGWDGNGQDVDPFEDLRSVQRELKSRGIEFEIQAPMDSQGPTCATFRDPDGNLIVLDQHR